jgi:hypothetical protein
LHGFLRVTPAFALSPFPLQLRNPGLVWFDSGDYVCPALNRPRVSWDRFAGIWEKTGKE